MKDFAGVQLKEGDRVAFVSSFSKNLEEGVVVGFTEHCVRIKHGGTSTPINRVREQVTKLPKNG